MPVRFQPPIALSIDPLTLRRFVLGQQGLYPGRRWRGRAGALAALHAIGSVQLDPVQVIARAHDLILASRVLDYQPDDLYQLAYADRAGFDYGELLCLYPVVALPSVRTVMARVAQQPYVADFLRDHAAVCDQVRAALRDRGPLGHRDLDGSAVTHYRARKDTGLALQRLWLAGELMTHSRRGTERLFDFADRIAPPDLPTVSATEADAFFVRQVFAEMGLVTATEWGVRYRIMTEQRTSAATSAERLTAQVQAGMVSAVRVDGHKAPFYLLTADLPLLAQLADGTTPAAWSPAGPTTTEEVTFLAPLEMVSARGRAKRLFNFDYTWEIYTPPAKRRYGYYVLPILYGDQLVGRIDPKLNRKTRTFSVAGLWLEDAALGKDAAFQAAFARGLARLARFHNADTLSVDVVQPIALRRLCMKFMKEAL